MGSIGAMKKGSKDRYFQENAEDDKLFPKGLKEEFPIRDRFLLVCINC